MISAASRRRPSSGSNMKSAFLYCLLFFALSASAQVDTVHRGIDTTQHDTLRRSVAIFAPLYLDSAFDASGSYRYDKNFPKFINPGLEFYEGVQMALDTLRTEHVSLEVHIYDTRS